MGPGSFQWCPVTGQGAKGTNWNTRSSIWTWGKTSLKVTEHCNRLPGEIVESPSLEICISAWMPSCLTYCRELVLSRVGLEDVQMISSHSESMILCISLLCRRSDMFRGAAAIIQKAWMPNAPEPPWRLLWERVWGYPTCIIWLVQKATFQVVFFVSHAVVACKTFYF